jgi:3-oxoacyl-[acyl-carrier protein] reductase
MKELEGKVAIITGAATGIGKAIAKVFALNGASVVINHLDNNLESAKELQSLVEKEGGKAVLFKADVSKIVEIEAMFKYTIQTFKKIDILVNNAAVSVIKPITEISEEEYDFVMNVNTKAVFFACQYAAKYMSDYGRIINISSATTGLFLKKYSVYDASKGALEQISRILAAELGDKNITVNTVSPGATDTELFRKGKSQAFIEELEAMSVFKRLGATGEIAEVVGFLASPKAQWITGQNIRVNGGTC